ncbi:MAG: HIT domain-containing protein [Pleurocapsa minor GSE-CHR-MK-17-07R]|jgi:ATP adenylyltransferase|nr:HIT domain-containing protein [Pleurocapsa minor GSE-CHR-MK 17-07R]
MDHLYTPWRMAYIRGEKTPSSGCLFCTAPTQPPAQSQVVARSQHVYVIMNRYPYNNGHVMVVPFAHVASMEEMLPDALLDLMQTTNRAIAALRKLYNPAAFNIGANIGQAAGAGIAEHFHLHVVPRWPGDANFMTVTGDTRVIADTIENTFHELVAVWSQLYTHKDET